MATPLNPLSLRDIPLSGGMPEPAPLRFAEPGCLQVVASLLASGTAADAALAPLNLPAHVRSWRAPCHACCGAQRRLVVQLKVEFPGIENDGSELAKRIHTYFPIVSPACSVVLYIDRDIGQLKDGSA